MSRLVVRAALNDPGGAINEDVVGHAGDAAWVIDGATGFGARRHAPDLSDARWYARALDAALVRAAAEPELPPAAMLERAIGEVAAAFLGFASAEPPPAEVPAAAVALVRASAAGLAYAVLGDCAVVLPAAGGVRLINDPVVGPFDRRFAEAIALLHREGITEVARVQAEMAPFINRLRRFMNRPGGFWVAALEPLAARHAVNGVAPLAAGAEALLASDGFLRLIEPFAVHDAAGLLAAAAGAGFAPLVATLRALERADPAGRRFPRLKIHDDASAVLLRLAAGP